MSVKVGIVNDMKLASKVLRDIVLADPQLSVCWMALDGVEAIAKCAQELPDIVLMDLVMPNLNGVEATRAIMAQTPCPILIVTATVDGHMGMVFDAMGAGAIDVTTTPVVGDQRGLDNGKVLCRKILALDQLNRAAQRAARQDLHRATLASTAPTRGTSNLPPLLAMGASTGGPAALANILEDLPPQFPAAIVIVQHIDSAFSESLVTWLDSRTALPVALARRGEVIRAGRVLVCDATDHLVLQPGGVLQYVAEPHDALHRPSVNRFFCSVALHAPRGSCGVLLTGMGRDGAEGLLAIRQAGFFTIAQDQKSSVVYGMPKVAAELQAASLIASLSDIATYFKSAFKESVPS